MDLFFLMILVLFCAILAAFDIRTFRKAHKVVITEDVRLHFYRTGILFEWLLVIIPIVFLLLTHRDISSIGLTPPALFSDTVNLAFAVAAIIAAAALLILLLYQIIGWICSTKYKAAADTQIRKQIEAERTAGKSFLYLMIPVTTREKKTFTLLSLTAGITEELLLRGFLFCLLYALFPSLSPYIVLAIGGVFFGILHAYQGVSGIVKTGLIGIVFGALYLATGSLIPGMFLHFIADFSSAFLHDQSTPNQPTNQVSK